MKRIIALTLTALMLMMLLIPGVAYYEEQNRDLLYILNVNGIVGRVEHTAFRSTREDSAWRIAKMLLTVEEICALELPASPFIDIGSDYWQIASINYLYHIGVIKGVSGTKFNPNGEVTAREFAAMLLRAIKYDVDPAQSLEKAVEIGIITQEYAQQFDNGAEFYFDHAIYITYQAFFAPINGSDEALLDDMRRPPIKVICNDVEVEVEPDTVPARANGKLFLRIDVLGRLFGIDKISFDEKEKDTIVIKGQTEAVFQNGTDIMFINELKYNLEPTITSKGFQIFIDVEAMCEAFGAKVEMKDNGRIMVINTEQ